ncbi:MAG: glycosyltransferase [Bacteroidota bacterium]
MTNQNLNIVHLGVSGFPIGFGSIQRLILLYKGLQHAGANVLVINRTAMHGKNKEIEREGVFEGVPYVYTSPDIYRQKGFLKRKKSDLLGRIGEYKLLRKLKKEGKLDAASVYLTGRLGQLLYYRFLSRLLRFPIILSYVEYRSAIENRKSKKKWIQWNDKMYDKHSAKYADGVLPISEFLMEATKKQSPRTAVIKSPVITDFDRFDLEDHSTDDPVKFLYVGAASYKELITFVLRSFEMLEGKAELHMVLGGSKSQFEPVKEYVSGLKKKEAISLYNNIEDWEIPVKMSEANALLIPLRPNIQDEARFPHKVGEYVASGKPLITTNYGEIRHYFEDGKNALIADEYSERLFANKMEEVINFPAKAAEIGKGGQALGKEYFDHKKHGVELLNFIKEILGVKNVSYTSEVNENHHGHRQPT